MPSDLGTYRMPRADVARAVLSALRGADLRPLWLFPFIVPLVLYHFARLLIRPPRFRLTFAALFLLAPAAWAQAAPASPDLDIPALLDLMLKLAGSGQYLALAVVALVAVVAVLRLGIARGLASWFPVLGGFGTDKGGATPAGLTGLAVVVGGGMVAGAPLSVGLVVSGLVAAIVAVGGYVWPKKLVGPDKGAALAAAEGAVKREAAVASYYKAELVRAEASPRTPEETRALARRLLQGAPRG